MFWFEYTYKTTEEILSSISRISDFSVVEWAILTLIIILLILSILYIAPNSMTLLAHRNKQKAKLKRKKLLTQIKLQKEIEDEILGEIESVE